MSEPVTNQESLPSKTSLTKRKPLTISRFILFLSSGILTLLLLGVMGLFNIHLFKPYVEDWLSDLLHQQVRIENISADWTKSQISFQLEKVKITDNLDTLSFEAKRVHYQLPWSNLLKVASGHLHIEQATLYGYKNRTPVFRLGGIDLSTLQAGSLVWNPIPQLTIQEGRLQIQDDENPATQVVWSQISLHTIKHTDTLEYAIGVEDLGEFGDKGLTAHLIWHTGKSANKLPLMRFKAHELALKPIAHWLGLGALNLSAVLDWEGEVHWQKAPFLSVNQQVTVSHGRGEYKNQKWELPQLSGQMLLQKEQNMWTARWQNLQIKPDKNAKVFKLPGEMTWQYTVDKNEHYLAGKALSFSTALLRSLGRQWLTSSPSEWLLSLYPTGGTVDNLAFEWKNHQDYKIWGQLKGVAWPVSVHKLSDGSSLQIPAIDKVSAQFLITDKKWEASFTTQNTRLVGLTWLDREVPIQTLSGKVEFHHLGDGKWTLDLPKLAFSNHDLRGQWQISYHHPASNFHATEALKPQLEFKGYIDKINARAVHHYLPNILKADLRTYWEQALTSGEVQNLNLQYKGSLTEFPFSDSTDKQFHLTADLLRLGYQTVPVNGLEYPSKHLQWPIFKELSGRLSVNGVHILMQPTEVKLLGADNMRVQSLTAEIFDVRQPKLDLALQTDWELGELFSWINGTPLNPLLSFATQNVQASGGVGLHLKLQLPLLQPENVSLQGMADLPKNSFQYNSEVPEIDFLQGKVYFNEHGLQIMPSHGYALGGQVTLQGTLEVGRPGTLHESRNHLHLQMAGDLQAKAFNDFLATHSWSTVDFAFANDTHYQAEVNIYDQSASFELQGNIRRLQLPNWQFLEAYWPQQEVPIRIVSERKINADDAHLINHTVRFNLGDAVSGMVQKNQTHGGHPQLTGVLTLNPQKKVIESIGLPPQGLRIQALFDELPLDDWLAKIDSAKPLGEMLDQFDKSQNLSLVLNADTMRFGGHHWHEVKLDLNHAEDSWQFLTQAREF
ncbi:MAG: DUF3971 domain-containing protein, partial [Gammaproteobacteria bacterium]|nr:DUF3971 domain-containing protein [Gammaproteobacteria bacterium]